MRLKDCDPNMTEMVYRQTDVHVIPVFLKVGYYFLLMKSLNHLKTLKKIVVEIKGLVFDLGISLNMSVLILKARIHQFYVTYL